MTTTLHGIYADCLNRLAPLDFEARAANLGVQIDSPALMVPFFNKIYRVDPDAITDSSGANPSDGIGIVLCQYLLHCPEHAVPDGQWVTFRELPGAGPLVSSFAANTNKLLAGTFAHRFEALQARVSRFNGQPVSGQKGFDLFVRFNALPKVPIFMQFNGTDGQFPAQCNLLFYQSAHQYLDMQSLIIIGTFLSGNLIQGRW